MASSDVTVLGGNQLVSKHREAKSLRLSRRNRRNRSISLDRYLFLTTKRFAKGLNVLSHNTNEGDKVDLWENNRINRSVSLPRISKENNAIDSREFCLASEIQPLEKKPLQENSEFIAAKKRCMGNGNRTADLETPDATRELCTGSLPIVDSLSKLNNYNAILCSDNSVTKVVSKVGHAVSLDTHLMIQNEQLTVRTNGTNDEIGCQSHAGKKEDPFIQGHHCSCPSLHCADHFSEAIKTCLDLGRTERSVIHEASGENDGSVETVPTTGTHFGHDTHSHSHSEGLQTSFQKSKTSSTHTELGRKGSWPWVNSTPKRLLKSYGSSDNIDTTVHVTAGNEDTSNKGFSSISAEVRPISSHGVEKHLNLESISGDAYINSVNKAMVPLHLEPEDQSVDADSNYTESLSGSQASLSSAGTSSSKGKKISTKNTIPTAVKGSTSKTKAILSNGVSLPKAMQKQSRLEQIRQQQQNRHGPLPSSVNKSSSANRTIVVAENTKVVKTAKRHTLGGITDAKSFVPRPSIAKRLTSDGMTEGAVATGSSNEDTKSKLPVKKMCPSQISRPAAPAKVEKTSDKAMPVQRNNSSAGGRPTVKRNSSLAQSDSQSRKQNSVGKVSNVAAQSRIVAGTTVSGKGPKGVMAAGSKSQTSRVARSSSSAKGRAPPAKVTKTQPSSVSTKKVVQPAKQNVKETPASLKQGLSKLPRKVSAQLSNASDSASVTSSIKDQLEDNLEDLHDTDNDSVTSAGHQKSDLNGRVVSGGYFQQDEVDARVISPLEAPCRIMPPDILSETPYLSKHSVGVQVDDDRDLKTIQSLRENVQRLHELVKQRTDLCWQLQNQLDEDSMDFVTASVMILSVVRKMQLTQKYCNQLEKKIESTLQEMNVVQEKLGEEEANSVKLQEEMMYQSSEHAVAIETLKADYENLLERTSTELKVKHEGEIALAIETHKAQVKEMHQQHEKEIAHLKKSQEEFVGTLREQHRDEIVEQESKHSSAFDELVEEHQVEIETIKADYDEQQAEFKEKYEKMVSECNTLNKKLQQVQDENQKDIETRIQEAVKKFESLPAELESIKAVLEMKNEEIRQLRKEKMEKYLELERLEDIKVQTKKLQQENESLSFVVESKSKFERQLSVERDTLKNSLERESAKSKRLSLENEELQWRLVNSTSPPTTPTGEERPLSAKSNRNSFRLSASFPDTETIDE